MHSSSRDLDTPEAIAQLVDGLYGKILADDRLRPLFVDVAEIELETHLPRIRAFWRKMLLGERDAYRRNMVARHLELHARQPLHPGDFERWLKLFREIVDEDFAGPGADRAKALATRIAGNLARLTGSPVNTQQTTALNGCGVDKESAS
ncbi:MAG: hypothetical protein CVV18_06070 [Gammaproteobacteria bacterium HGW-Gammaproteobacteria-8]|nr:MAG: hypothetical protein CVV18_06070 [Gammaproteobacteria bacterium HGW-Gammaproteobacteria-8]